MIYNLITLDGLIIELCGAWIWLSGETRQHKDTLKTLGCYWSKNKKMWYWRGIKYRSSNRRGAWDINKIRNTYRYIRLEFESHLMKLALYFPISELCESYIAIYTQHKLKASQHLVHIH